MAQDCSKKKKYNAQESLSSGITYDGETTCLGFGAGGELNALIIQITEAICEINQAIINLDIDADEISIDNIVLLCLEEYFGGEDPPANLTELLNGMIEQICGVQQVLANLNCSVIPCEVDLSCLKIEDPILTIQDAIEALRDYLCDLILFVTVDVPLNPFTVNTMVVNDVSGGGQAAIEIEANIYWTNNKFTTVPADEIINLPNNKDNYIFLNSVTGLYILSSVNIGDPSPVSVYQLICTVTTGVGVLATVPDTSYLYIKPVNGDHIDDDSISEDMIRASALHPSLTKIVGKIGVDPQRSIERSGVTGRIQLKNDVAVPTPLQYYGTNLAGLLTYHDLPVSGGSGINGDVKNVSVVTGGIDCTGDYNIFRIIATDGSQIDTVSVGLADKKITIIENILGSGVYINASGNVRIPELLYLEAGSALVFLFNNGNVMPLSVTDIQAVTFAQLNTLITANSLLKGCWYLITDFATVYDRPDFNADKTPKDDIDTITAGNEPLLVFATSNSTLALNAFSILYPQDEIHYDPSFTLTEVMASPAKGRITYRKDHLNNKVAGDFRAWLFKRYESAPASGIFNQWCDNGGASALYPMFDFTKLVLNNRFDVVTNLSAIHTFWAANNVFKGDCYGNTAEMSFLNNTAEDGASGFINNSISTSFFGNIFSHTFRNNKIGASFSFNVIGHTFRENNTQDAFQHNTIGNECQANDIQAYFRYNTVGNECQGNTIGKDCWSNTIGNAFNNNRINTDFGENNISNNFENNTLGVSFTSNTIGGSCNGNNFGNFMSENTIGLNCMGNNVGNNFFENVIGDNFKDNTVGNLFTSNTIVGGFTLVSVMCGISGVDFSLATHVYDATINKQIYLDKTDGVQLRYYDGGALITADITD